MLNNTLWEGGYLISSALFILGLKLLGSPTTARRGNYLSAIGMFIAIAVTMLMYGYNNIYWISLASILGAGIGYVSAKLVKMTDMPQMIALFNGFGGIASLLVSTAEFRRASEQLTHISLFAMGLAIVIGGITFTGSLIAYGKLAHRLSSGPIVFGLAHKFLNALIALYLIFAIFLSTILFFPTFTNYLFLSMIILSLLLGVLLVIPIGGADMPVVISLLNSYSGLAACATGFVILNNALIVSGALVGASGIILTRIMCKAMNRSLQNVLLGNFKVPAFKGSEIIQKKQTFPINIEDAYTLLEAARHVVIVPGYGMAVAQAQHAVKELVDLLEENDTEVKYAIHPVAGRMPGHMNVLLAEANVPYEELFRPEDINPTMDSVDVCLIVGANDVTNPAAQDDPSSPIYGMPIIEAHRARTVLILKRSLSPGFSGVDNLLFYRNNTRMLFDDAKTSLLGLSGIFKERT